MYRTPHFTMPVHDYRNGSCGCDDSHDWQKEDIRKIIRRKNQWKPKELHIGIFLQQAKSQKPFRQGKE